MKTFFGSSLRLRHHLVDLRLHFVRQIGLAELEVALIFAQHDFVHETAVTALSNVSSLVPTVLAAVLASTAAFFASAAAPLACWADAGGGLRLLIDFGDPAFVLARALLRLLDRAAERVNLVVDLADAGSARTSSRRRRSCRRRR